VKGFPDKFKLNNMKKKELVLRQNVGLDTGKNNFAACFTVLTDDHLIKHKSSKTFTNNEQGFQELQVWWQLKINDTIPLSFTMEATGVYYENLAYFLHRKKQIVHVVLPNKSKKFLDSLDTKSKTDKLDAKGLGLMGLERPLQIWEPISDLLQPIKCLTRERGRLVKQRTIIQNQLHALKHAHEANERTILREIQLIEFLNSQINEIENELQILIKNDEKLNAKIEKLDTIPGIGWLTAIIIVAETNGFASIKNVRQLISYAGYDIQLRESGSWKGKSKISKKGNSYIRAALYFPALNCVRRKNNFTVFYNRIKNNKGGKSLVACTALQRKLLALCYVLWKNDTVYSESYSTAA